MILPLGLIWGLQMSLKRKLRRNVLHDRGNRPNGPQYRADGSGESKSHMDCSLGDG